jgi:hypothetical protein
MDHQELIDINSNQNYIKQQYMYHGLSPLLRRKYAERDKCHQRS